METFDFSLYDVDENDSGEREARKNEFVRFLQKGHQCYTIKNVSVHSINGVMHLTTTVITKKDSFSLSIEGTNKTFNSNPWDNSFDHNYYTGIYYPLDDKLIVFQLDEDFQR